MILDPSMNSVKLSWDINITFGATPPVQILNVFF